MGHGERRAGFETWEPCGGCAVRARAMRGGGVGRRERGAERARVSVSPCRGSAYAPETFFEQLRKAVVVTAKVYIRKHAFNTRCTAVLRV